MPMINCPRVYGAFLNATTILLNLISAANKFSCLWLLGMMERACRSWNNSVCNCVFLELAGESCLE
jgi:hypothetical protein